MAELLEVGSKIPQFETIDQDGNKVDNAKLMGRPSVIYFYPKDDTPGCTVEACEFRDENSEYKAKGINVYGISVDTQASHKKFQQKFNLNFPLLVDNNKKISEKFGVMGERSAKRVTFLVDDKGGVVHVFPKVTPKGHTKEVLETFKRVGVIK